MASFLALLSLAAVGIPSPPIPQIPAFLMMPIVSLALILKPDLGLTDSSLVRFISLTMVTAGVIMPLGRLISEMSDTLPEIPLCTGTENAPLGGTPTHWPILT